MAFGNELRRHYGADHLEETGRWWRYGCARLYGPMAVAGWLFVFLPLFEDLPRPGDDRMRIQVGPDMWWTEHQEYGALWELAANRVVSPAGAAVVLAAALICCLVFATVRPTGSWRLPVTVAVLALLLAVMLIVRPGFGYARPDLSPFGTAALALAVAVTGLGTVHAVYAFAAVRTRQQGDHS